MEGGIRSEPKIFQQASEKVCAKVLNMHAGVPDTIGIYLHLGEESVS